MSSAPKSRRTDFSDPGKIVGYDVEIQFHPASRKPDVVKHWLGTENSVRRKARMMHNFHAVLSITPVTAQGWKMAYGYR